MFRIAVAGFQHETNTFVDRPTTLDKFLISDSWPQLLRGAEVLTETSGMNLPVAGFINRCNMSETVKAEPVLWCAAEPSGKVTTEAFETIANMIIEGIAAIEELDAVYLDLHGAMVCDDYIDGDLEIIKRVRKFIGPHVPLGVSFDLHANISADTVNLIDVLTIYKTYPHLDMADTGVRNFDLLLRRLNGETAKLVHLPINFLIPLHAQLTDSAPLNGLRAACDRLERNGTVIEIALGFTASDTPQTGPSVVVSAKDHQTAHDVAQHVVRLFDEDRYNFNTKLYSPEDAVNLWSNSKQTSFVFADVQDNPGAGASSDTTGLLRALVNSDVERAVVGLLCDPQFVSKAAETGVGNVMSAELGGKSGITDDTPLIGQYRVEKIKDGVCYNTGEMYRGCISELGNCVQVRCLDAAGCITAIVTSNPIQCLDQAHFTYFGLDLNSMQIIGVKSTLHYRADFEHIVDRVISVASPGQFPCILIPKKYSYLPNSLAFL